MAQAISSRFSRKVTITSFILAVFIMYIHAKNQVFYDFGDITGTPLSYLHLIFSDVFGLVGVPFFFLMSGYWLFRVDIGQFRETMLLRKMKKKVSSLVVPYLIGNTIGFLFYFTVTHIPFLSASVNGGEVVELTWENVGKGIFLHKYYYSFWFMQDLIVLTAISPIILLVLRNRWLSYGVLLGLVAAAVLGVDIRLCQTLSLTLFLLGGILAVYHRDFWEKPNRNKYEAILWAVLFLIGGVIRMLRIRYFLVISQITAPICFWKMLDCLDAFGVFDREPPLFCKQSFFIYASHILPVEAMNRLLSRVNPSMAWACVNYLINPPLVLLLIWLAAKVMNRICPRLYKVLCGGRS